ncbi:VOC family protein [Dysgonomonas sp. Marseille-P4677]|uniref:VOC family protein n=1 Tax=Dysgonomonas sp. Marseille-P4677 TaxID=2364790 RepID=UPI001914B377|nr:VOC family protein [Dysgonomonas sp. Marseille-P4677]MBK5722116.1 VOC family protein [Dysgonomonas sp. Marseille-P4677]
MKLTSYLVFNGLAEEAANFYANVLGGKIENFYRYESMPAQPDMPEVPNDFKQKIMHCCIDFPGGTMSLADALPSDERNFGKGGHMLTLMCESIAQTEEVYAKLCTDAQEIQCELAEAFFARRYAEVVDRYGVLWAILYCENQ